MFCGRLGIEVSDSYGDGCKAASLYARSRWKRRNWNKLFSSAQVQQQGDCTPRSNSDPFAVGGELHFIHTWHAISEVPCMIQVTI